MTQKKFKLRPGQTDFTRIRWAPVINCVLKHKNKILIVQRSRAMQLYPGYWNGISGFLDDNKSLKEKVYEEVAEEAGLDKKHIRSIRLGKIFDQDEPKYKKTWIVHPVLVTVDTDAVVLDWEAQNFKWLKPDDVKKLKLMPGFDAVLQALFKGIL